jgi:seryl-tRNA synthetase
MLDINLIRDKTDYVKAGVSKKGYPADLVDKVLAADQKRLEILQKVENLRRERNEISADHNAQNIERGKQIKEELKTLEPELEKAETEFRQLLNEIPNLPADDVPEGKGEEENVELRKVGEIPNFAFPPKDHVVLGKLLDIIDFEAGAKVAGAGFYYLKNEAAILEIALVNYGLRFLSERGFSPILTPDLAKERYYLGTGYLPKGEEAQTYKIEDSDLGLIATAEVTVAGYHADEILDSKNLPKKYAGFSHCFRMESGAYGKYSKGLYRVHQFSKVEMFALTTPADSAAAHELFLKLEEEFWQSLGVPYRVIQQCTGDLGAQAVKKFDLEAWMPGRGDYGEITSTSNTTDYQARNLNIRIRDGEKNEFAHTLNGTLIATSRGPIAILENFQQEDGSVRIPEVLVPYTGFSEIHPK